MLLLTCVCRTLLMGSYLGEIPNVTQLVNEQNVYPDIADMQGNTALMYATVSIWEIFLNYEQRYFKTNQVKFALVW